MTSILQQLRASSRNDHRRAPSLEQELRIILQRIDAIRTLARDLKHKPKLTAEDTKGLDKLEETLKDSLKKDGGD